MTNLHLLEDEAALYVIGGLTEVARGEFEDRLAQSSELRALVRELQQGAVAVAMASPRRRVPPQLWPRIEKAVRQETKPQVMNSSLWFGWLRHGWAAAAVCLLGWMLSALWADRTGSPKVEPTPLSAKVIMQPGEITTTSIGTEAAGVTSSPRNVTHTEPRTPEVNPLALTRKMDALRLQNAELLKQVTHLSQVSTQQQALLSESDRLKFFQLQPASAVNSGGSNAPVSSALQRALFLALARELGWLQLPGNTSSSLTPTNQSGIDFVDLHPGPGETTAPANLQSQIGTEQTVPTESPSLASGSGSAIPGFVSGSDVILAFDSVVPANSELTFWTGNSVHGFQSFGSAMMGTNVLVVRVPTTSATPDGTTLTVTTGTPTGSLNVIGQVFLPGTTPP